MKKIIIYTSPNCYYCHQLKDFLNFHKIEFEEKDISQSQEVMEEMIRKSGQIGVPVIDIDGEIISGFYQPEIEEKLGISK